LRLRPSAGRVEQPGGLTPIAQGAILSVVDQGGEHHTFTEVKEFGNGFVPQLNPGSATTVIPECSGGFKNIAVARTRILQGSDLNITGLSKGKHLFECCIHPWMRMEVDVKCSSAASAGSPTARGCSQFFHPSWTNAASMGGRIFLLRLRGIGRAPSG
jgi:hypothetical protein